MPRVIVLFRLRAGFPVTPFPVQHIVAGVLYIGRPLEGGNQQSVEQLSERPQRAVDIKKQHHPLFVCVVPYFVVKVIIKDDAFAFFPAEDLIVDANPAVGTVFGDNQSQVDADNPVGGTPMRGDPVMRRQDGNEYCSKLANSGCEAKFP
ncbi:MAG: hypothetical protein U9P11_01775 [Pseudomonadota bacterium]|nr:hypothetical protein [Pseudomonadota bacterium]